MKRRLQFLPGALADLEAIWRYSARHWGADQADDYLRLLHEQAARLIDHPSLGSDVGHLRPGFRRIGAGTHHLYYLAETDRIRIVRVLHQRMDVGARLMGD